MHLLKVSWIVFCVLFFFLVAMGRLLVFDGDEVTCDEPAYLTLAGEN